MAKPFVLLLDDDPAILDSVPLQLRREFDIECASTLGEALEQMKATKGAVDVAVVDMWLGEDQEGGLKAIREIRSLDSAPEIIVLTAYGSQQNIIKCMEAGAFSYVEKSGRTVENGVTGLLVATIRRALETRNLKRETEDVKARYVSGLIRCLAAVIDSHDPFTAGHSRRVAECARIIALEYGLSDRECEDIKIAGTIHDLGMIGIDTNVLTRSGPLTNIEWAMIREHPREGARILQSIPELSHLIPAVIDHQEQYEGGGYPAGKKGDGISVQGRILAVADAFDAMVSDRPYQTKLSLEEAFSVITEIGIRESILRRRRPGQFDPAVVEAFKKGFDRIRAVYVYDPYYPGEQELTIVLSDIVGSTKIAAEVGDLRHKEILEKYFLQAEKLTQDYGGVIVKHVGEVVIAVFHVPQKAVNFAIELQHFLADPMQDVPLQIRVGIHTAEVRLKGTAYGGDVFGPGVILTARLEDHADPGEVILSDETWRRLPEQLGASFEAKESVSLQGFSKPIKVWFHRAPGREGGDGRQ